MSPKHLADNWRQLLFGIGCIVLGVFSLLYRNAFRVEDAQGRQVVFKLVLGYVWGWPLGIVGLLLGAAAVWASFLPDRE